MGNTEQPKSDIGRTGGQEMSETMDEKMPKTDAEKAEKAVKDTVAEAKKSAKAADSKEDSVKEEKAENKEKSSKDEKLDAGFEIPKKKKKDKKDEKIEALTDQLKRQMAEFDNFRKRTDKEKQQMFEVGARDIIERILPIVDNFERGLASVDDSDKDSALVQGMEKIYKQLETALEEAGVKAIDAVGKTFDPAYHNAVMHVDDEEAGENVVVEEFQKGYMYRETVVRHSMVKVAN